MNVSQIESVLVRHRFLGKFGWHFHAEAGRRHHGQFRSASYRRRDMIRIDAHLAEHFADVLLAGEMAWGQRVRDLAELVQYPSTVGDKLRYLHELTFTLRHYRLKNGALSRRLIAATEVVDQVCEHERGCNQQLKDVLAYCHSLLADRRQLVVVPADAPEQDHARRRQTRMSFSAEQIDRAQRTWRFFPGFSGEDCGECYATANVLAYGPGWFCECGHYNCQSWSCARIPHEAPDYGPALNVIRTGVHASCGQDCKYCHGQIRLVTAA